MVDERLKKKEDESRESYIHRVYSLKVENNLTNKEVAEIINKELDTHCQESYFRIHNYISMQIYEKNNEFKSK